jgi:hypothetical protein
MVKNILILSFTCSFIILLGCGSDPDKIYITEYIYSSSSGDEVSSETVNPISSENINGSSTIIYVSSGNSSNFQTSSSSTGPVQISIDSVPRFVHSVLMRVPDIGYPEGITTLRIQNNETPKTVIISSILQNVSLESFETINLHPWERISYPITPTLDITKFDGLDNSMETVLNINVSFEGQQLYSQSKRVVVTANDNMVWEYNDFGDIKNFSNLVSGFVTPGNDSIETLINDAKYYMASGSFIGYQGDPILHIDSIFLYNFPGGPDTDESTWLDPYLIISSGTFSKTTSTKYDADTSIIAYNINAIYPDLSNRVWQWLLYDFDSYSSHDLLKSFEITIPSDIFDQYKTTYVNSANNVGMKFRWDYATVNNQVKAIYRELQTRNLGYASTSTTSYGVSRGEWIVPGEYSGQKVRYPMDVLQSKNFNCIDGVVLMASALENIGIKPVIILIPEHALLGWYTNEGEYTLNVLETTTIETVSFENAMISGMERYLENIDDPSTRLININTERNTILPFK